MHRFYAAFGGSLCTAQGDGLAGVQRLCHRCCVLQIALCVLHTVLCGLLYSGLQAGKLPLPAGKLLVLALQELGSGKLIKPIIA